MDNFLTTFYEWSNKYHISAQRGEKTTIQLHNPFRQKTHKSQSSPENMEYVSPYSVHNLSGYTIEVATHTDSEKTLMLADGDKRNILLESKMEDAFADVNEADLFSYRTITIKVHHAEYGLLTSHDIAIDDLGAKLVQYEDSDGLDKLPSNARLVCNISIEEKKKLITLSSSISFQNCLPLTLIVLEPLICSNSV